MKEKLNRKYKLTENDQTKKIILAGSYNTAKSKTKKARQLTISAPHYSQK